MGMGTDTDTDGTGEAGTDGTGEAGTDGLINELGTRIGAVISTPLDGTEVVLSSSSAERQQHLQQPCLTHHALILLHTVFDSATTHVSTTVFALTREVITAPAEDWMIAFSSVFCSVDKVEELFTIDWRTEMIMF
jgi:hypothetical protein